MVSLSSYPSCSIIIVNYNGEKFINKCLSSVLNTDYPDFEVIFIDNASTDGSLRLVKEKFIFDKKLKVIKNNRNLGPVVARNIGIKNSNGRYVAFLDNDTEVEKGWLKAAISVFLSDTTIGAAQSKLLLSDKKTLDTCGHFLSFFGFPYEIGSGEPDYGQYDRIFNIFAARSAAMIIRRDVLDRVGNFDFDYFIYSEETDLNWRVWLSGYRVIFIPDSIVYHKRGGSLTKESQYIMVYEGAKNCTKTLIKNLEIKNLLWMLPFHVIAWLMLSVLFIFKLRLKDTQGVLKGLIWNLTSIRRISQDRHRVQKARRITDKQISLVMFGDYNFLKLFKKGLGWLKRI